MESANSKASNISMVRQAMPSAWPSSMGLPLFHDAGSDIGKGRQLRGQRQAGRTAAHDQHIDLRGHGLGMGRGQRRSWSDQGVAGTKTVQMKLHGGLKFFKCADASVCPISPHTNSMYAYQMHASYYSKLEMPTPPRENHD
jgi:hypothetical protein